MHKGCKSQSMKKNMVPSSLDDVLNPLLHASCFKLFLETHCSSTSTSISAHNDTHFLSERTSVATNLVLSLRLVCPLKEQPSFHPTLQKDIALPRVPVLQTALVILLRSLLTSSLLFLPSSHPLHSTALLGCRLGL